MKLAKNPYLSKWIVVGEEKPSEKTKEKFGLPDDLVYHIMLNLETGELKCDCYGYLRTKSCKHIKKWKEILLQKIKDVLHQEGKIE
jgi:hypothetical protein